MKKTLLVTCLFILSNPVFAGLYDDIDRSVGVKTGLYDDILKDDNPYKNLTPEEATRLHNERMKIYDELERNYRVLIMMSQTQQQTPQQIHYGYNAMGEYVPTSVGNQKIHYGYNAFGEFVPMSIGD